MTTTDRSAGTADDLPRRRRARATTADPIAPPPSRRAARLAAARQDAGEPVVLPPGPAQFPLRDQSPLLTPGGTVAAGVVGRSTYGAPDEPPAVPFAGYPVGAARDDPVLDLDALAHGANGGGANGGEALPPGVRAVGDLQIGPATTPIRRRRPVSLPESFEVPDDDAADPGPDRTTTPLRTQPRAPRAGALRLRGGPAGDDGALPAPPPVVSASPGGTPFAGAPPTGSFPMMDAASTGLLTPEVTHLPAAGTGPGRAGPGRAGPADEPDPPRTPPVNSGPAAPVDGAPVAGAPVAGAPVTPATPSLIPPSTPGAGRAEGPGTVTRRSLRRAVGSGDGPEGRPAPAPGHDDGPDHSRDRDADADAEGQLPARRSRAGRNLPMAIAVGVGLAAVVLASLLVRKEAFVAVVCVASVLAMWELASALTARQIAVPVVPLAVGSVGMLVSAFVAGEDGLLVSFALTSFGVLLWRIIDGPQGAARDVAASVFAAAYVPFLAGFTMLMLAAADGAMRILVYILVVVASDTGGYTAGVLFGKHPMAPTVSPNKSWEGFVGSTVACMLAGSLGVVFLLHGVWYAGVAAGAAAVVTATVGDLSESLLKRDLGIKDMGHLLPGHGGMLDRIDSLLLTAPVVYVLLSLLVPVG
jgi:CDP-diglyceride synthetase